MSETAPPIVLFDASALYPAALRNLFMRLAGAHLFQARWSAKIQDEWAAALLRDRPELAEKIIRVRALMGAHVADAEISGYEHLVASLTLPDPNDRHVLAAAIHGGASVIVTVNLRDFPATALAPYSLTAQHPDAFVFSLLETDLHAVLAVMREHRLTLKNPPKTVEEYLATFEAHGMTKSVAALRQWVGET